MKVSNKTQQKDSARVEIEEEGIRNLESQKVKNAVRGNSASTAVHAWAQRQRASYVARELWYLLD